MLLLLGLLLAVAEPANVTIEQLRADPKAWAGKTVRLRGQIDQCQGWSCNLCPEAMTAATADAGQCLSLSLDDSIMPHRYTEDGLRFSQVVLTARFDPTCMLREGVICTDRASVLLDGRVEKVTARYRSAEGVWNGRPRAMLAPLPEAEAAEVIAAATRYYVFTSGQTLRAFRALNEKEARVLLCSVASYEADKPESWPKSWESAILSPSAIDRFNCYRMKRIDGDWHFATN